MVPLVYWLGGEPLGELLGDLPGALIPQEGVIEDVATDPSNLMLIQLLRFEEVCQVLLVGRYSHWVIGVTQISSPMFQGLDDRKHLFIIDG
ncbi:hypothetical protein DSO57_1016364, partial [Entomophthora muscae]